MKKITFALAFLIIVGKASAQQNWTTSLMDLVDASEAKIGTKDAYPMGFYIDGTKRMTLGVDGSLKLKSMAGSSNRILQVDGDGVLFPSKDFVFTEEGSFRLSPGLKFGIGIDPSVALDVNGEGKFSGNLNVNGQLILNNNLKLSQELDIKYIPAVSGRPGITIFEPLTPAVPPSFSVAPPCNMFYTNTSVLAPNTYNNAFQFADLLQVYTTAGVVLNMGINNGDGIISAENGTAKLRLNPGCSNDVFIGEGGGYTKMFSGAGVIGDLTVTNRVKIGGSSFAGAALIEANLNSLSPVTEAVRISNNSLTGHGQRIFDIGLYGETYIGSNLQINSSMLTVGQAVKANLAFCLTDNTTTANKDFFRVYGNGVTEIISTASNANDNIFSVKDYSTNNINFAVKKNGFVYAREVIVTLNNFPDYVFSKDYHLPGLQDVRAFIQKNHRLPNMPSADEINKNGANLGEIQKVTVEKVEELYLYILQLEEKINDLNAKLEKNLNK